ncbi:TetR/AcrR family transcriptional regulator [Actibacterium sp. 188UL27-1]|uniref:TetR/AcrR family transcriptional regulator n=1 Tax=Actibacterium sp. 188UL27-1 TaxID=2786961 RepID=UPI001956B77C|nr:TetR/AcrR family transcriptional regulator [Actibacterium sp. 188UL27-1]MBM7066748.1 TetR/AcrR family transcriptional regulator [Actibacterium sp. 188UL27-1]
MAEVKENHVSSRRQEILAAATQAFLDKGFSGTSMTHLAKVCGIQKASLYHHFPGKEDLFIACVTDGYAQAVDQLDDLHGDDTLNDVEKITAAFDCLYRITISSPVGRLSPVIAEVSRTMPNVAKMFHANYIARQQAVLEKIISAGVERGSYRPQNYKVLHHLVFGPIVTLSLSREMFASFDDLDSHFPVDELKAGHLSAILTELGVADTMQPLSQPA